MTYRVLRPAHRCQTPIEALQLAEDLERINNAMLNVGRISDTSVCPDSDRQLGNKEILEVLRILRQWHNRADAKLKYYLREDSPPLLTAHRRFSANTP